MLLLYALCDLTLCFIYTVLYLYNVPPLPPLPPLPHPFFPRRSVNDHLYLLLVDAPTPPPPPNQKEVIFLYSQNISLKDLKTGFLFAPELFSTQKKWKKSLSMS